MGVTTAELEARGGALLSPATISGAVRRCYRAGLVRCTAITRTAVRVELSLAHRRSIAWQGAHHYEGPTLEQIGEKLRVAGYHVTDVPDAVYQSGQYIRTLVVRRMTSEDA